MITDLLDATFQQWRQQSWLEVLAVITALLYVWLAARESIWCWPNALISTSLYVVLFWNANLPYNSFLNAYYLAMGAYGWYQWSTVGDSNSVSISQWPLRRHIVACIALTFFGYGIVQIQSIATATLTDYLDVLVMLFSLYTTFLVTRKILENWLFWIVINGFATYLYFSSGLVLTGVLFVCYFFFAIYGYLNWRRIYIKSQFHGSGEACASQC